MPDWLEALFDLAAQFTGGRQAAGPNIVWFGIAAFLWGTLAFAAYAKHKRQPSSRERLLLCAFLFGFARELFMLCVKTLGALGLIDPTSLHAAFPPLEHALQNVAMVLVAAGFIWFLTEKQRVAKSYVKTSSVIIGGCYLATFWWWADFIQQNPASKFGQTWCDWTFHIMMSLLLSFPIYYLAKSTRGWMRNAVCAALACFWLFEFLKLPDIATGEVNESIYAPIRHGLYLVAISLFGYTYIRELVDELGWVSRQQRVLERAIQAAANGVVVSDAQGDDLPIVTVNAAFERMTGYSREEMLGRNCRFLQGDDRDQEAIKEVRSAIQEQRECKVVLRNYRKDGSLFWNELTVSPVHDENETVSHFVGIQADITDRKRLADELNAFFDISLEMLCIAGTDGRFKRINPAFSQTLGYTNEEFLATSFFDLMHPDDKEVTRGELEKLAAGHPMVHSVNRFQHCDGSYRWIEWNAMSDPESGLLHAAARDVTERREFEVRLQRDVAARTRELRDAQQEIVRNERLAMLGQIAGGVAHEIRNPMGIMRNAVYFLQQVDDQNDQEIKQALGEITRGLANSERIVSELFDFARGPTTEASHFSVDEVLKSALEMVRIPGTVRVVRTEVSDHLVHADRGQIERLLANLIQNAAQAMPRGGTLTLRCDIKETNVVASISDTGIGIAEDELEKVFEPLFSKRSKGIGLGLPLCRRYAELNGGSIIAESTLGQGSTFRVTLPLADSKGE